MLLEQIAHPKRKRGDKPDTEEILKKLKVIHFKFSYFQQTFLNDT